MACIAVGAHLMNSRDPPPGLLISPFLQSMQTSTSVSTIPLTGDPSSNLHFTSADLRPESSVVFPPHTGSHLGFNAFSQRAPAPTHPSQSFSPWSSSSNALQLRDSNQQNFVNSSLVARNHNGLGDTWKKPTPNPPPTRAKDNPPTWSQIAAKDPQPLTHRTSTASIMTESRIATAQAKSTVPAIPLANKDTDLDMAEASAPPASPSQAAAPAESPMRESRYITDSLAFISSGVNNDQNISVIRPYTVLKIKNVVCALVHVPLSY